MLLRSKRARVSVGSSKHTNDRRNFTTVSEASSLFDHAHGPGCPCSAASNKPYYNRGMKQIAETKWRMESKGQAIFRPIKSKRPLLNPSRLLAPSFSTNVAKNPTPDTDYAFEMAASNIRCVSPSPPNFVLTNAVL